MTSQNVETFLKYFGFTLLHLSLRLSIHEGIVRDIFILSKIGQPRPPFLFIFVLLKHKFYRKTAHFSGISTRIVGVEGHLTTTTARESSLILPSSKSCYWSHQNAATTVAYDVTQSLQTKIPVKAFSLFRCQA